MNLKQLAGRVAACERCERLRAHCVRVGEVKRRAYLDWDYWAKPVPSFGDSKARLLLIGLAPGAHGANRTGRMFTGDASGDLLFRSLHRAGFASQPESRRADDGLKLKDAYITASARCAPPDNAPTPGELANCREYLEEELRLLRHVRVVVTLGQIAFRAYLSIRKAEGRTGPLKDYRFGHNLAYETDGGLLISSYHPSQQNTSTGRLTEAMLDQVFDRARRFLEKGG